MTERPILFAGPTVRAILDGRKTQHRVKIKLPTRTHSGGPIYERPEMGGWEATTHGGGGASRFGRGGERIPVPEEPAIWHRTTGACMAMPWKIGDRAWVRESGHLLREAYSHEPGVGDLYRDAGFQHSADGAIVPARPYDTAIEEWIGDCARVAKPSIHMPRWASRITLLIENVRVQRLRDISEADAVAEGCPGEYGAVEGMVVIVRSPIEAFRDLWNTIHGPGAWGADPWVAALTFRRVAGQGGADA